MRKQVEMLNSFSDSIRERQEEAAAAAKAATPKEDKRLRNRNDELESKIEKLTSGKSHYSEEEDEEPSFFDKLRNR